MTAAQALVDRRYSGPPDPGQVWQRRRTGDTTRMFASWDIPAPEGTPVHAVLDGEVIYSGVRDGYGETVILLHRAPPETTAAGAGAVTSAYCHLRERRVQHGDRVEGDQVIGTVGMTFHGPEGDPGAVRWLNPHLHFSVQRVSGDANRTRYRDDQGELAGSRQLPDPTEEELAGIIQPWFQQAYEEDWTRQVKPDDWTRELGVADAAEDLGGRPRPTYPRRGATGEAAGATSLVELELVGEEDAPVAGEPYRLHLPNGEVREGTSDEQGLVHLEPVPEGDCRLELPRRTYTQWELIEGEEHDEGEAAEGGSTDAPEGEAAEGSTDAPEGEAAEGSTDAPEGEGGESGAPAGGDPPSARTVPGGRRVRVRVHRAGVERVWVWLGRVPAARLTAGHEADLEQWLADEVDPIGATDAVVSVNSHDWAGSYGPASWTLEERIAHFRERMAASPPRWAPLGNYHTAAGGYARLRTLCEALHARDLGVHLMVFPSPEEPFLTACAAAIKDMVRDVHVPLRSVHLDTEWWWTFYPAATRDAGAAVVQRELFDGWPADLRRPELGIGVTGIASAAAPLTSLLRVVDFGVPQIYYQAFFLVAPVTRVGNVYDAYLAALGHTPERPRPVIVGQTANRALVGDDTTRARFMLDTVLQVGDPGDPARPPPRELSYWSHVHFRQNPPVRDYVRRVTEVARRDGLTRANLPAS